ncbi:MAG: LptF/LptG family permease [Planctomycetota bacterium]|nr:LptF/LptG family permease [Planctomycetota bacterium]MDA1141150.1 LptF/LptG family permease [Planctomycetota bacterium]
MRVLQAYIFKEFRTNLLSALVIFTSLMFLMNLLKALGLGFSILQVASFMAHYIPYVLTWSIPMSVLTATVTTFSKFSETGELIAMQSGGIHALRLMKTLIITVFGLVIFSVYANATLIPESRMRLKDLQRSMGLELAMVLLTQRGEKVINLPPYTIYVDKVEGRTLHHVDIQAPLAGTTGISGHPERMLVMRAQSAQISTKGNRDIDLLMRDGHTAIVDSDLSATGVGIPLPPRVWFWEEGSISISGSVSKPDFLPPKDMTITQLRDQLHHLSAMKRTASTEEETNRIATEIHTRISLSLVSFVFVILGAPLGMLCRRANAVIAFGASLFLSLGLYYPLLLLGQTLGKRGFEPMLVMWAPNALFTVVGLMLFRLVVRS